MQENRTNKQRVPHRKLNCPDCGRPLIGVVEAGIELKDGEELYICGVCQEIDKRGILDVKHWAFRPISEDHVV